MTETGEKRKGEREKESDKLINEHMQDKGRVAARIRFISTVSMEGNYNPLLHLHKLTVCVCVSIYIEQYYSFSALAQP